MNDSWLIIGLGKTGLSCAQYFHRRGDRFSVYDTRENPPDIASLSSLNVDHVFCQPLDAAILTRYQGIVLSPGVSAQDPAIVEARNTGVEIVGDIELFAQAIEKPIIGITGSNGKSTVTTLVGDMLTTAGFKVGVGGNIGLPALDLLHEEADYYVLELSSFQLETSRSLYCRSAVVLNVCEDHMDRHNTIQTYAQIKQKIYRNCLHPIINRDDPLVREMVPSNKAVSFGIHTPTDGNWGISQHGWLAKGDYEFLDPHMLKVKGTHNWLNMLVAFALVESVGATIPNCLAAAYAFTGLQHRTQWVAEFAGNEWINDSKATNVGACIAAIQGFTQPIVLIAGGDGKGADFSPLYLPVKQRVSALILMGQDGKQIHLAVGNDVSVTFAKNMADAVRFAKKLASPGDVILLSPACASYDMYRNYEERGLDFCNEVKALEGET